VAEGLRLELPRGYGRGFLTVDCTFKVREGADRGSPQVFIEYENRAQSAMVEVEKLCYLRAPLKILITFCRWPDKDLRKKWVDCVAGSWKWLPEFSGIVYGFVIADIMCERQGGRKRLCFHFFGVSADGVLMGNERTEFIGDL
jgi:hypothetical protein